MTELDYRILDVVLTLYLSLYLLKMYITVSEIGWMVGYILSGSSEKLKFESRNEQRRYAFSFALTLTAMGAVFNFLMVIPLLFKEGARFFAFSPKPTLRQIADFGQTED